MAAGRNAPDTGAGRPVATSGNVPTIVENPFEEIHVDPC